MVVLDSDQSRNHVSDELKAYAPMVSRGCYLIVEDSAVNDHPTLPNYGPCLVKASDAFLARNPDFEIDLSRERFLLTFNPRGHLRGRA